MSSFRLAMTSSTCAIRVFLAGHGAAETPDKGFDDGSLLLWRALCWRWDRRSPRLWPPGMGQEFVRRELAAATLFEMRVGDHHADDRCPPILPPLPGHPAPNQGVEESGCESPELVTSKAEVVASHCPKIGPAGA